MHERLEDKERSIGELRSQEDKLKLENQRLTDEINSLHKQSRKLEEAARQRRIRLLATIFQLFFVVMILGAVALLLFWLRDQFPNLKSFVWAAVSGLGGTFVTVLCAVLKRDSFEACARWVLAKFSRC